MAAALTMNISMIALQDKLYSFRHPLNEKQRSEILNHPERSVDMLEKCGVRDEVWLHTIIQHHELLDGSGYPQAEKESDITQPSRVITLGDLYGAKISNRSYRKPMLPTTALREIFTNQGQRIDPIMSKILIKNLGLYPPGSFVELGNGEIAVVTRVASDARYPVVCSVVGANGKRLAKPAVRDTSIKIFEIKKILTPDEARIEVNRYQLWGYMQPAALAVI
jgi:HD-GYP domain-containing protein (c-di-GMP phosphodiesterase class II)